MSVCLAISESSSSSSVYLCIWEGLANAFSRCTVRFSAGGMGGGKYGLWSRGPCPPLILDRDPQTFRDPGKGKGSEAPSSCKDK